MNKLNKESASKLYNSVRDAGYDLGDYNSYISRLNDPNNSDKLYSSLKNAGFDIGSDYKTKLYSESPNFLYSENGLLPKTEKPTQNFFEPTNNVEKQSFAFTPEVQKGIDISNNEDYRIKNDPDNVINWSDEQLNQALEQAQLKVDSVEADNKNKIASEKNRIGMSYGSGYAQMGSAMNESMSGGSEKRERVDIDNLPSPYDPTISRYSEIQNELHNRKLKPINQAVQEQQLAFDKLKKQGSTNYIIGGDMSSTEYLMNNTIETLKAPSKYDNTNLIQDAGNMAEGFGKKFVDRDTWSLGITQIERNLNIKAMIDKVQAKKPLSKEEQLTLATYMTNLAAHDVRDDISLAYQAGSATAESLPYMAMFMGTGGIGTATRGAITKLVGKSLGTASETLVGKFLGKAAGSLAETAVRTAVMPTTYGQMTGDALQKNTQGKDYTVGNAMTSFGTAAVENFTELGGGYLIDKGLGKIGSKILGDKAKGLTRIGNAYHNNPYLKTMGVSSPIGEIAEEYLGGAINYGRGLNPLLDKDTQDNLKQDMGNLLSPDGFKVLAGSILPMTMFPMAHIGIKTHRAVNNYEQSKTYLSKLLQENGETEENANSIISFMGDNVGTDSFGTTTTQALSVISENFKQNNPNATQEEYRAYMQQSGAMFDNFYKQRDKMNQITAETIKEMQSFNENAVRMRNISRDAQNFVNSVSNSGQVISARLKGVDEPVNVTSGNVVLKEDGTIDYSQSDKTIIYKTSDGKSHPGNIDFIVDSSVTITPAEQAVAETLEPIQNQIENEEAPEYEVGSKVVIKANGLNSIVTVTGRTEDGNYTFESTTPDNKVVQGGFEPREVNKQFIDVFNGERAEVEYTDPDIGEAMVGTIDLDTPEDQEKFSDGSYAVIDGQDIPFENIKGRYVNEDLQEQPEVQGDIENPKGEEELLQQRENETDQASSQEQAQEEAAEPIVPKTNMEQIPIVENKGKATRVWEQAPKEITLGALREAFDDDAEVIQNVEAKIAGFEKKIEKAAKPRITDDIDTNIANKAVQKVELKQLNDALDYWSSVRSMIATEQVTTESELNEITNYLNGSYQNEIDSRIEGISEETNDNSEAVEPISAEVPGEEGQREIAEQPTFENGDFVTYNGETYTINGVYSDGSHYDLEQNGKLIHEEVSGSELKSENNTNFVEQNNGNGNKQQSISPISEQGSQGVDGKGNEGTRRTRQIATELQRRSEEALRDARKNSPKLSEREQIDIINRTFEQYAKENGLWIKYIDTTKLGEPAPSGTENEVYFDVENKTVYKVNNLIYSQMDLLKYLDNIELHNKFSPLTPYELVGFTGFENGTIYPVVKQRYIANSTEATPEQIDNYMNTLGFTKVKGSTYTNGRITVSDLLPRNVLVSKQGTIYIIDDIVNINKADSSLKQTTIEQPQAENLPETPQNEGENKAPVEVQEVEGAQKSELAQEIADQKPNVEPTDKQKETGNYKKARINVQGFNITIENPKGSTRSGVSEDGKEWSNTLQSHYGELDGTIGYDGDPIDVFVGPNPKQGQIFVVDQVTPINKERQQIKKEKELNPFIESLNGTGIINTHPRERSLINLGQGFTTIVDQVNVTDAEWKEIRTKHKELEADIISRKEFSEWQRDISKRIVERTINEIEEKYSKPIYEFDESKVMLGYNSSEEAKAAYMANYEKGWNGFGAITETSTDDFKKWLYDGKKQHKPFAEYKDTPEAIEKVDQSKQVLDMVKGVTVINEEDNGKTLVYGTKNNQTRLSVVGFNEQEIKDEISMIEKFVSDAVKMNSEIENQLPKMFVGVDKQNAEKTLKTNKQIVENAKVTIPWLQQRLSELSTEPKQTTTEPLKNGSIVTPQAEETPINLIEHAKKVAAKNKEANYGNDNKIVSNERYEELKRRMKGKLGNLNAGFDPETFAIGAEMAAYHIEAGARSFKDFAKRMINDLGETIKPYLKSFYNGARDLPGMEKYDAQMDEYGSVRNADVDKLIKDENKSEDFTVKENNKDKKNVSLNDQKFIKEHVIFGTIPKTNDNGEQTRSTEVIESEAAAIESTSAAITNSASNVGSDKQRAGEVKEQLSEQIEKVENLLTEVDNKLANLRLTDKSYSTDGIYADYPINVLAKGEIKKDLTKYIKAVAEITGLAHDTDKKGKTEIVNVNIEPAGGDATFFLWSKTNPEEGVYVSIPYDPDMNSGGWYDNYKVLNEGWRANILYRVVNRTKKYDGSNQYMPTNVTAQEMAETLLKGLNDQLKAKGLAEEQIQNVKQTVSSAKIKKTTKSNKDIGQTDLMSLFEETEITPTQNEQKRGNKETDSGLGSQKPQETAGLQPTGVDRSSTTDNGVDGGRSSGISDIPATEGTRNTRNNVIPRGKEYAPSSPKARFDANIEAIKIVRRLIDSGKPATKADQQTLRQFSGWGGLGTYFNNPNSNENKSLREVLTTEEYESAVMSINSAYYTPATINSALWDVAEKLGFKGGNVLEGSAGIGNIIGSMPREISGNANIEAVEIDEISGSILKYLYPDAKVHIKGFEETNIPNGSVDLAITNVPFVTGLHVYDPIDKDLSRKFKNIHDFCIAKNIRKLKEGGIGIFITSNGTLDKSRELREWIGAAGKTDVIGAFRLNNDTFGGTNVTSDIIIVRKRIANQKHPKAIDVVKSSFVRSGEYETKDVVWDKKARTYVAVKKQTNMEYNDYFKEHPENMAGEMAFAYEKGDTFRPGSVGLYPSNVNQNKQLKQWLDTFEDVAIENGEQKKQEAVESTTAKEGQLILNAKGKLSLSYRGVAKDLGINDNKVKGETKAQCLTDYNKIKTTLQAVLDYQVANEDNAGLNQLLYAFNRAYDNFVAKYGQLNKNTTISFLRNDVDFPSIVSIEKYSETKSIDGLVTKNISKTSVFKGRVVSVKTELKPTNTKDAVIASVYKYGAINLPYISKSLNRTEQEISKEIIDSKLGFKDPATGSVVIRHEYLSGDVRGKLKLAQSSNDKSEYSNNIEELQKVIPMDIPAHLIEFTMGTSWLDNQLYVDYFKEKYNVDAVFQHREGRWTVAPSNRQNQTNRAAGVYSEMLQTVVYGSDLATAAMNLKPVTISEQRKDRSTGKTETITDKDASQAANTRVSEIRDDFKEFVRAKLSENKEQADKMAQEYNDRANSYVPMEIDDTYLPERFEGSSEGISLYAHQKKATIRGTMEPLMLAHEVGAGKTFVLISTAMEMRRLGTANKPMVVVQNATVGQFVTSAKQLYPNAKILTITENDRTPEGRRMFYAKIKYSDWDMIVVPQSTFEMIPDSPEMQSRFIEEKIDEKLHALEALKEENDDSNKWTIAAMEKELEGLHAEQNSLLNENDSDNNKEAKKTAKTISNAAAKAKEQLDRRIDDVQYFDQMGIDALLVDEAHEYKRLGFATSMTRGVKGIDPAGSKKSAGIYLKTRVVLEKSDWKNVVFATGTPISNTAAEIWTFMKYLIPKETLIENEIYYFDDFVRNFGSINQSLEFATNGSFKENTRFSSYINKPELIRLWSTVTDTVLSKDVDAVNDKIPLIEGDKATDIFLPQTPSLIDIMRAVKARLKEFENMSGKQKRENSSIPIVMYGIAKRAAIDTRLVSKLSEDEPNSKTNKAVEETIRSLKDSKRYKGTVAIFCDAQNRWDKDETGKKVKGFDLFEDIKAKLIAKGVAESEIMIIKPGMTVARKEKIFDAVKSGEIRVVLGNTKTLGTGVNMQERLHTLIHMDAPDRPMDYTQRNGRILRQGNLHKEWGIPVRILRFGVEDSLDVTSYQRLKTKSDFINSIMDGKSVLLDPTNPEGRILDEDEEGLFDNPVAVLSGSQYALLKNQAERELRKWESKKKQHEADQIYIQHQIKQNSKSLEYRNEDLADLEKAKKTIETSFANGINTITIAGKNLKDVGDYVSNDKTRAKVNELVKPIAKAINEKTEEARQNAYFTKENVTTKLKFNGVEATITTEIERESLWDDKIRMNKIVMHKTNHISVPELGIDTNVGGKSMMQTIEFVYESVDLSKINDEIKSIESKISQYSSDNASMEARRGKPFAQVDELQAAKKKVVEFTELMKQELAAKEEKYKNAGSNKDVEINDETEEEETDDDVKLQVTDRTLDPITEAEHAALVAQLEQTGLASKVHVMNTQELEQAEKEIKGAKTEIKTPSGITYGFVHNGEVYLNSDRMNRNTPIHEFGHLFTPIIKEQYPEFYAKGVELIKKSPYYEQVKNDPNYSDLSEDAIIDEAINQAIGDKGAKLVDNLGLYAKLKHWMNQLWERIGKAFGIKDLTSKQIQDLTLEDWTDIVNAELLSGKKLIDINSELYKPLDRLINTEYKAKENEKSKHEGLSIDEAIDANNIPTPTDLWGQAYKNVEAKHPILTYDNIFNSIYKLGKYLQPITEDKHLLNFDKRFKGYPIIDRAKAEEFKDNFDYFIDDYAEMLVRAKSIATEAAQEVINDTLRDIEYAKDYYARYAKGEAVWRTETSPKFQIIGEQGASALDKAQEANTRMDNLNVAMEMEKGEVEKNNIRGGVYNSAEYKTANKVQELLKLRGIDKHFSISDTNFGKSMYFIVADEANNITLKIRISDHSVSNYDRIFNEQHENSKSDPKRIADNIELAMYPDRYTKTKIRSRYYNKNTNQWIMGDVIDGKSWVKSYNNEATEKYLDSLDPEKTRIVSKEFVKVSKSKNKIYKVTLENLVTNLGEEPIYKYERKEKAPIPTSYTPEQIRMATGWERGADGKWRYEVEDAELKLKLNDIEQLINTNKALPLSEVMDISKYPYPELNDYQVEFYTDGQNERQTSFTDTERKVIGLRIENTESKFEDLYRHSLQRGVISDGIYSNDSFRQILLHEVQHIVQLSEGFGRGGSAETLWENLVQNKIKEFQERDWFQDVEPERQRSIASSRVAEDNHVDNSLKGKIMVYRRLGGEVESRNVQARMNMSAEERRNTLLSQTEDVAREAQIILHEGLGVSASIGSPKPVFNEAGHENETLAEYAKRSTEWREQEFISGMVREERKKEAQEAEARGDTPIDLETASMELDMKLRTVYDKIKGIKGLEKVFGNKEMWQDAKLPVKVFLDHLRSKGAKIAAIDDYHLQSTSLQGKNDTGFNNFLRTLQKPINKWIRKTIKHTDFTYRDIENYVMLKHGLERNEYFQKENKGKREDYSGLYAIAAELYAKENGIAFDPKDKNNFLKVLQAYADNKGIALEAKNKSAVFEELVENSNLKADFDKLVEDNIANFESGCNLAGQSISDFWDKVNAANDFSLEQLYRGGIISKQQLADTKARYNYYIPLRGHEAEAEKTYDYTPDMGTFFSPAMIGAKGRVSRAENPFGFVVQMAQSAIVAKNRNLLNQTLLRVARADKTGLITQNKTWYIKTGTDAKGKKTWEEAEVELRDNDEVSKAEYEAWQERMKEKEALGEAKQFATSLDLGGLFIKKKQKKQHAISVMAGGVEYQVYINGNPKVSRAINGLNKAESNSFYDNMSRMKSVIGKNVTSRNPAFMATNFSRDIIYASTMLGVKEGAGYTARFIKNMPLAFKALTQYQINPDKAPLHVREFFENGGETGFSHLWELQDIQKEINRAVSHKTTGRDVWDKVVAPIDAANKIVENATRLATFMTSRENGRPMAESINNAKEVTVNFNTKGAGGGVASFVRSAYLFINAAVQALNNFGRVYKQHPVKMTAVVLSYAMSGALMPLINAMLSGDDDEYWNLPEWERQNNLCIWVGNGFVKIPLPQELRAFHRIGDNVASYIMNKKEMDDALVGSVEGLIDLMPMNPSGAIAISLVEVLPDGIKPAFQAYVSNQTFTGSTIALDKTFMKDGVPQFRQVKTNRIGEAKAPAPILMIAKVLNDISGGNSVQSGNMDINPDKLNHLMRGYLGGVYTTAMQPIESITKRFYTNQNDLNEKATGGNLGKAYEKIDAARVKVDQFNQMKKDIINDQLNLSDYARKTIEDDLETAKGITRIGSKVSDINSMLKDPTISDKEKDDLRDLQNELLQMIDSIEMK